MVVVHKQEPQTLRQMPPMVSSTMDRALVSANQGLPVRCAARTVHRTRSLYLSSSTSVPRDASSSAAAVQTKRCAKLTTSDGSGSTTAEGSARNTNSSSSSPGGPASTDECEMTGPSFGCPTKGRTSIDSECTTHSCSPRRGQVHARPSAISRSQDAARVPESQDRVRPGQWVPGEFIGTGSFGKVFKAMNCDTGEEFAVKSIRLHQSVDEHEIDRIAREVEVMRTLHHSNVIRYLGHEISRAEEEPTLLIFQEWVPGNSLSSRLKTYGHFSDRITRRYTKQVLSGLDYLHSNGVVHMDINCNNLLLDKGGVIKLADFGTAGWISEKMGGPEASWRCGTPLWMAPEVLVHRHYSPKADIWSVGGSVLQMATNQAPWSEMSFRTPVQLYQHMRQTKTPPHVPGTLSGALRAFIERCFSWDPDSRPSALQLQGDEFLQDIFTQIERMDIWDNQSIRGQIIRDLQRHSHSDPDLLPERQRSRTRPAASSLDGGVQGSCPPHGLAQSADALTKGVEKQADVCGVHVAEQVRKDRSHTAPDTPTKQNPFGRRESLGVVRHNFASGGRTRLAPLAASRSSGMLLNGGGLDSPVQHGFERPPTERTRHTSPPHGPHPHRRRPRRHSAPPELLIAELVKVEQPLAAGNSDSMASDPQVSEQSQSRSPCPSQPSPLKPADGVQTPMGDSRRAQVSGLVLPSFQSGGESAASETNRRLSRVGLRMPWAHRRVGVLADSESPATTSCGDESDGSPVSDSHEHQHLSGSRGSGSARLGRLKFARRTPSELTDTPPVSDGGTPKGIKDRLGALKSILPGKRPPLKQSASVQDVRRERAWGDFLGSSSCDNTRRMRSKTSSESQLQALKGD